MVKATALVLGVNGQDGSYLAESMLARGYDVVGVGRQPASRYVPLGPRFRYVSLNLTDAMGLSMLLDQCQPQMVMHMAAIHGASGFQYEPVWADMVAVNVVALHAVLEFARALRPDLKVVYAGSSKVFGLLQGELTEDSPVHSTCLYSNGKISSLQLIRHYRDQHGVQCGNLFLFNHESPRRPAHFFVPMIAHAIAAAKRDARANVTVRTLDFRTDWSCARELMDITVDCVERAAGQDFVMASGKAWLARDAVRLAFERHGLDYRHHITESLPPQDSGPNFLASTQRLAQKVGRVPQRTVLDIIDDIVKN